MQVNLCGVIHSLRMNSEVVHQYFEKATALVLAAAGVESVEKQALHLLAGEAERYARDLGVYSAKLAEAARRSECTVADIEAAAALLNKYEESSSRIIVPSDLKKKLRLSVSLEPVMEKTVETVVSLPQLAPDSVEAMVIEDDGAASPSKSQSKRLHAYPEWLQKEIDAKQNSVAAHRSTSLGAVHRPTAGNAEPLSFISSLVMAEEEARKILTSKLKPELPKTPVRSHI
jgi:hypothetical protein